MLFCLIGTFCDERRNTPPDPVCWADFALAAFDISSDIMPLLRVSHHPATLRERKSWSNTSKGSGAEVREIEGKDETGRTMLLNHESGRL
jgi:hypothetical protein